MGKCLYSFFAAIAATMLLSACMTDDSVLSGNDDIKTAMTFTAAHEPDGDGGRAEFANDGRTINWQADDRLSVFDGSDNNAFVLTSGEGTNSASFEGSAASAASYTAVYPYADGAVLAADGNVEGVALAATQRATAGSFDRNAALMMARSDTKKLSFRNAVGFVKFTLGFACKQIELQGESGEIIAGKATLAYNDGEPTLTFTSEQSTSIILNPATDGGEIAAGTYYIAVPAVTLSEGWGITFRATDDKEYVRKGSKPITFKRSTVTNIGSFEKDGTYWYDASRGYKVRADQEVDMGITVTKGGKTYKVIFAKSNLAVSGLDEPGNIMGNYFAWAATSPWILSYRLYYPQFSDDYTMMPLEWAPGKESGYQEANTPYYNNGTYEKYKNAGDELEPCDDAARQILGGDWQIPTKEIWQKLLQNTDYTFSVAVGDWLGFKLTQKNGSNSLDLPLAGQCAYTDPSGIEIEANYWANSLAGPDHAWLLYVENKPVEDVDPSLPHIIEIYDDISDRRYMGYSVRPVRLVEQ